ncbi:hypothetical protein CesoFtcFv8_025290 [Champsocephalus esox]|nr:hypothetical protein CesoFtcFv8_025290 [Champsocephalus esox]
MAGTYTVQLVWAQRGEGAGPGGAIARPPGAAPDRLGTSGQIWEGNVDGGAREGPAAREQPCSRAASQNPLLTADLQTRGKPGCGTDSSSQDLSGRLWRGSD